MKPSNDSRLLKESIPSYMQVSPADMKEIYESFLNIFKTFWSSVKLLSSTLALNLKVITYTLFNDQKWIDGAFAKFATARATYDSEMIDNLEYFRKNYSDSRLDTLGGFGPKMLALAANPLLFFSNQRAGKAAKIKEKETPPDNKPPKNKKATEENQTIQKMSDRLKAAMAFFGFSSLSEAVQTPVIQSEYNEKLEIMSQKAKSMLATETIHAQELLSKLSDRVFVIKKIVNAKDFDEMIEAAEAAEKIKIDFSPQSFRTAYQNISDSLKKEKKDKPEQLKKAMEDIRLKFPDITEKDDIKAMTNFVFGIAKANIQAKAAQSYNDLINKAKSAMFIPVDEETKEQLLTSDEGKKYLAMLDEFEKNLESGQKEMSALTAKKV